MPDQRQGRAARTLLYLALASAAVGLCALGGYWSRWLDIFTHFVPIWGTVGLVAAIVAAVGSGSRARLAALGSAVLIAGSAAILVVPEIRAAAKDRPQAASGPVLKVIQFNLWTANADLPGTLAWIRAQNPDVILIEEAQGDTKPLRMQLRQDYPRWSSCEMPPGSCPVLVLSRLPLVARGGIEDPSLAWATYSWQGRTITLANLHDYWPAPAGIQQWQLGRAARLLSAMKDPTLILTGDFNSTPWSHTLRRFDRDVGLQRHTHGLMTWPARLELPGHPAFPFPFLAIDQVYAGSAWRAVSVTRGPRLGSDHYPVVAELTLR